MSYNSTSYDPLKLYGPVVALLPMGKAVGILNKLRNTPHSGD